MRAPFWLALAVAYAPARADVPVETTVVTLEERWRIGGESEDPDELFGVLNQIAVDAAGNVYLLDAQLTVVHVFDADGAFLRRIGREGEGPGEFRRPADLLLLDDGTVGVVQRAPGKIVLMSPDGAPAGEVVPSIGDSDTFVMLSSASAGADGTILATVGQRRFRSGRRSGSTSLVRLSRDGEALHTFASMEQTGDLLEIRERDGGMFGGLVWAAAPGGRVFVSPRFDAYEIDVHAPDGAAIGTWSAPYTSRVRSDDERVRMKRRFARPPRGRRGQGPPPVVISETDRDVQHLYPRAGGSLWVVSSSGAFDAPEGAIATFDEFDATGAVTRRITLLGEGDFHLDGVYVEGDRVFVVTGLWDAVLASRGLAAGESETDDESAEPVSVICYSMPLEG